MMYAMYFAHPTVKSTPTLYRNEIFSPVKVLSLKESGNQVVGLVLV